MATVDSIISQGLELAGNTAIATSTALAWLNNFLQAEYRRKYPWQRLTISFTSSAGVADYTAAWDSKYLDCYQQKDGSVGRYTLANTIYPMRKMDYREWIARPDRLASQGPPRAIVPDLVGAAWHLYPVPDAGYAVTVDIYQLPALLSLGQTPLWSQYAPDEILVQLVKVNALFHSDDTRHPGEYGLLFGDDARNLPGLLPTYRRRVLSEEGMIHDRALDPRVFLPMPAED